MSLSDEMDLFAGVVELKSLAAAGRKFGISPAGMTAKIQNLEQKFEAQLLERTTRSIRLTEAGKIVYESALRIRAEYEQMYLELQENRDEPVGPLRVNVSKDFGMQYLAPALRDFTRKYPKVKAELTLADFTVHLIQREVDLVIRMGKLQDSNFIAQKLADNYRVLCAGKGYIEKNGIPKTLEDLKNHSCLVLHTESNLYNRWFFIKEGETNAEMKTEVAPNMVVNDGAVLRRWAIENAGIAVKSIWDVKKDLKSGRLIRLFPEYKVDFNPNSDGSAPFYCLYPSRKYLPKRVSEFIQYLREYLQGSE